MGTRNTLGDLNNHLFEQLERLNDDKLQGERLSEELNRSQGMATLSKNIIENAKLVLEAEKFKDNRTDNDGDQLRLLSGD